MNQATTATKLAIRLDKWLWAARFFRTRALAKTAIEGGKVHYNGQRAKVSKIVEIGALLTIRQGFDEKQVTVIALSDQRRGAVEAQGLYEETADSIKQRMDAAERRKQFKDSNPMLSHRPNKKERRQIHHFKQTHQGDSN
jgi:ribosome-associated heat shock protein Hsp15